MLTCFEMRGRNIFILKIIMRSCTHMHLNQNEEGFTLIEMLIVMSVIALLLVLITPRLGNHNENIAKKSDEATVSFVNTQIQAYYLDNGEYPESLQALVNDDYLKADIIDPNRIVLAFETSENKKVHLVEDVPVP